MKFIWGWKRCFQ